MEFKKFILQHIHLQTFISSSLSSKKILSQNLFDVETPTFVQFTLLNMNFTRHRQMSTFLLLDTHKDFQKFILKTSRVIKRKKNIQFFF